MDIKEFSNINDFDFIKGIMLKEESELFQVSSDELIKDCLNQKNGFVLNLNDWDNNITSIALCVYYQDGDNDKLSSIISPIPLNKIIHIKSVIVLPEFRGHGMQTVMTKIAESIALEKGYTHAVSSVHRLNTYCLNNLIDMGYELLWSGEYYDCKERDIMIKQLGRN